MQKALFLFSTVLLLIISCSSGSNSEAERSMSSDTITSAPNQSYATEDAAAPQAAGSIPANEKAYSNTRPAPSPVPNGKPDTYIGDAKPVPQLIKTVEYRFQADNVDKTAANTEVATRNNQGYVSSSNFNTSSGVKQYNMVLRVPNQNLEKLLAEIDKEAVFVNSKNVRTSDVTEEYTDIQTRLKTKRDVMERYVEVLRKKAQKVDDILDAEEKIRVLQEEIEAKEGRLRFLQNQVAYSTLNLEFYQQSTIQSEPNVVSRNFFSDLLEAFVGGWHSILGLIVGLISIWPTILILVGLYFLVRRFYVKWRDRK